MTFELARVCDFKPKEILKKYPMIEQNNFNILIEDNKLYIIIDSIEEIMRLRKIIDKDIIILENKILEIYDDYIE